MASNKSEPTNGDIMKCLDGIVSRLDHMDKRLNGLEELKVQVTAFDKDLKKLWTLVEDKNKITENRLSAVEVKVDTCEFSQDKLYGKVVSLESKKQSLKEEIVYLQAQSMRNNLVFSNITETENETNEEAEEKIKSVCNRENESR